MSGEAPAGAPGGEVVVYESPDGEVRVDVRLEQETVWLSQRDMATVFGTSIDNVGLHLKNIFSDEELSEKATTEDFSVVRTEGRRRVRRRVKHYDLDAIISVGYRVNSRRGVRFRQWATRTLGEHLVRGFTANERKLAERGLDEARQTLARLAGLGYALRRGQPDAGTRQPWRGAAQAFRRPTALPKPRQCRGDARLVQAAGESGRPLSQQRHRRGGGSPGTDRPRHFLPVEPVERRNAVMLRWNDRAGGVEETHGLRLIARNLRPCRRPSGPL